MIKREKVITCLAGMIFVLTGIFAGEALAAGGIAATKHNLSVSGLANSIYSTTQEEICVFCHTPHAAIKNDNIPLWNHTLSTTATYGTYSSLTMTGAEIADLGIGADPAAGPTAADRIKTSATVSNLCLSCHDGTVAINSLANPSNQYPTTTMSIGVVQPPSGGSTTPAGTVVGGMPAGNTNLGNLGDDHPVNVVYDPAKFPTLKAEASLVGVKLFGSKVQCASCHDPHSSADPTGRSFLRMSMGGSALCMACHNK